MWTTQSMRFERGTYGFEVGDVWLVSLAKPGHVLAVQSGDFVTALIASSRPASAADQAAHSGDEDFGDWNRVFVAHVPMIRRCVEIYRIVESLRFIL